MSANRIFCVKFRKNRLYFLGQYAIIKIQQAESEESAMQTTRRLAVLTVLAAVLIAAGALFLIAPVWQPQRPAAAYVPAAVRHCRAGVHRPAHRHQHGHGRRN